MNKKKVEILRDFIDKNPDRFTFGSEHWEIDVALIDDRKKLKFCNFSRFGTKTYFPVAFHRPISKSVNLNCLQTSKSDE